MHRTLDGAKEYRLHPPDGPASTVGAALVTDLLRRSCRQHEVPAATFILTEHGRAQSGQIGRLQLGSVDLPERQWQVAQT
ncbi:MAG: hypothetical protein R2838_11930 [Caldilineaceae bacterium]